MSGFVRSRKPDVPSGQPRSRGVRWPPIRGGQGRTMSETPTAAAPPAPAATERINFAYHAILGVAMGAAGLFTALAWIPAILTGMVIGKASADQAKGIRASAATRIVRVLAVTGGVLAMLLMGALIGGLIAFLVAALASFSERLIANAGPNDQTIARIFTVLVAVGTWVLAIVVLKVNVNISIGG